MKKDESASVGGYNPGSQKTNFRFPYRQVYSLSKETMKKSL